MGTATRLFSTLGSLTDVDTSAGLDGYTLVLQSGVWGTALGGNLSATTPATLASVLPGDGSVGFLAVAIDGNLFSYSSATVVKCATPISAGGIPVGLGDASVDVVDSGVTISAGVVTATGFVGSGAGLTDLPSGGNPFDQSLNTTDSPTFAEIIVTGGANFANAAVTIDNESGAITAPLFTGLINGVTFSTVSSNSFQQTRGTAQFILTGGSGLAGASFNGVSLGTAAGNATGDFQAADSDLSSWALITRASGFDTFTATPSSANLAALVTNETGTGALVFGTAPTITLANGTGLPISTGVSGLGTGTATALAVNVGSAGAFLTFNGAGGTPSSITLTNASGTATALVAGNTSATSNTTILSLASLAGVGTLTSGATGAGFTIALSTSTITGTLAAARLPSSGVHSGDATGTFPTVTLNAAQTGITSVGTLTGGTWNATVIAGLYGGTGVANSGKTITLGGNLATTGTFATTFAQTGTGTITLPSTSATMARTDAAQNFTGSQTFTSNSVMSDARIDFQHSSASVNSLGLNQIASAFELGFRPTGSNTTAFFDIIPNGTVAGGGGGRSAVLALYNSDRVTDNGNYAGFTIEAQNGNSLLNCFSGGSGTLKPFDIYMQSAIKIRFATDGSLLVGNTTNAGAGFVSATGGFTTAGTLAVTGASTLTGAATCSATLRLGNYVVSGLPAAATAGVGATAFVTDGSTTLILGLGLAAVGGGSNKVPVYSDGTSWIVG